MKTLFKNIGSSILGVVAVLIFLVVPILIVGGGVWLVNNFYQAMGYGALAIIILAVMLILLSIIPTLRAITGTSIYALSFLLGGIFWLACLYTVYSIWGLIGVILGLIFLQAVFLPTVLAILLDFGDPLSLRLIMLGILAVALAIIYGLRILGIWITSKSKTQGIKYPPVRYTVAVIVGIVAGYLLPAPVFAIIDYLVSRGNLIQTSPYVGAPINWLVVLYMIAIGAVTGFLAGFIAEKRGKLMATIAQLSPLILVFVLSLIINRDLLSGTGQANISTWIWVGLIPAIIAGHYGQKYINNLNIDPSAEAGSELSIS